MMIRELFSTLEHFDPTYLSKDIDAVNFSENRDLSIDTLEAGSHIRRIFEGVDSAGQRCWIFQIKYGRNWVSYRSYEKPIIRNC